ncbi:multi-sensor signal transduction histidine kinase [Methanospirillum hungatei JF-1]|uniref:histidine kinase n=1 Tax=Methanospirillum hungatei JF-1 (strain ATCC 27890 / DSM 864 / NBRC 100397 / JF-1) TaxID=323259 RepID=Q2FP56_METHJ|nr:PAS domain S-box protein [Methanospirillum hungatei]ABD41094.1 multi-sensor signal transduction histidine kinase [Methanospirillum hungatei JF-1]
MISILLVDDDPALLEACRLYLEDTGEYAVDTSLSATEALIRLQQKSYDAIIADYEMPDMNALQFLSIFRRCDPFTPFIVFTGRGREDVVIQALEGGADYYLQKGEDPKTQFEALRDRIAGAVARRKLENAHVRKDRLLAAIAECTRILLMEKEVNQAIQQVLDIIGPATNQDRIYIFQAHTDPKTHELLVSQRFEWTNKGVDSQLDNPDLQNMPFQIVAPYSFDLLHRGKMVSGLVKNHPESEREILAAQGIISILLVPIIVDRKFWGFIGFDNCRTEYEWNKGEKETLLTLANSIGSAIARASVEDDLRKTNEYLENLITNASGPIIVWDPELHITGVNRACEILTGCPAHDLIGKDLSVIFHQQDQERWACLMKSAFNGERWDMVDIPVRHRDGSVKYILWNSSPIYSTAGGPLVATIAQGLDITEKLRLEEEKDAAIKQIKVNFAQQAVLNDGIRNPLAVITGYAELIPEKQIREMIVQQVSQIDSMVTQLDRRWNESESILQYLQKHHNIHMDESCPAITSPEKAPFVSAVPGLHDKGIEELILVLDTLDILIYIIDLESHELIYGNQKARELYGDMVGKPCYQVLQKGQTSPCPFCTNRQLTDSKGPLGTHVWERKNPIDGRWYECHARAIPWINGRLVRLEMAVDISGRKHAEEILLHNEERYRQISSLTSDFAFSCVRYPDGMFHIDWMAGAVEPITGYTIDELKEKQCWRAIVIDEDLPVFDQYVTGLVPGQSATCELWIRHKNGDRIRISCKTRCEQSESPAGVIRLYGGCDDITQTWQVQKALTEREERYHSFSSMIRMMCDTVPDMIWAKDLEKKYLFANKALCEDLLNARDPSEPIGKTDLFFAEREKREHPENPEWHTFGDICRDTDQITMDAGEPRQFDEYGNVKGKFLYLDVHKAPFLNTKGEMIGTVGSARDVTRQKEAEVVLKQNEERFRAIVNAIPDILFTLDENGVYLTCHVNDPALLISPEEELIGKSLHDLLPEPVATRGLSAIQKTLRTGKMQFFEYFLDIQNKKLWFEARIIRSAPREVLAIIRDITEERYNEEALRQSNVKLRLLTSLTRHDIYNKISAVDMFHNLALQSSDPEKIHEYVENARIAGEQIEKIISFTREYENFGIYGTGWLAIQPIVESACEEVECPGITFYNEIPQTLEILTDPIIRKVFTTLLENSIRHGEQVTQIRVRADRSNGDCIIVYEDDGIGIVGEDKEMIFEHGYGKHTGIGLFLAREILSITGLSIRECGTYQHGVRFEITVPTGKWRYGEDT